MHAVNMHGATCTRCKHAWRRMYSATHGRICNINVHGAKASLTLWLLSFVIIVKRAKQSRASKHEQTSHPSKQENIPNLDAKLYQRVQSRSARENAAYFFYYYYIYTFQINLCFKTWSIIRWRIGCAIFNEITTNCSRVAYNITHFNVWVSVQLT